MHPRRLSCDFKNPADTAFVLGGCGASASSTQLSYWVGVHDMSTSKTRKYTWSRTSSDAVTTAQYNAYIKPHWGPGKKSGTTDSANKCMLVAKDTASSTTRYITVTRYNKLKGPARCCQTAMVK